MAISSHIHNHPILVLYQISQWHWPKEPGSIVVSDGATTKNVAAGSSQPSVNKRTQYPV